jgi:hypothetical protein
MDLTSRLFPAELHEFGAPRSPPAPGSTIPGDLYCDLQSRTLWLGVDPSVDPAEAVLVSDIISLTQAIMDAEADANAYTDTQILTRAPTVHTHTASQITDFSGAVTSVVAGIPGFNWIKGMILMYSGSLVDIGVGDLAGWSLCDGSNGTPDLRDRFIIGAGNKPIGNSNNAKALNTANGGTHTHTINGTALTLAQIPSHTHGVSGSCSASGSTDSQGSHQHGISSPSANLGATGSGTYGPGAYTGLFSAAAGAHAHNVTVSGSISGTAAAAGSGGSHTHTAAAAGDHFHTITANDLRDSLAYYALAFIMKL